MLRPRATHSKCTPGPSPQRRIVRRIAANGLRSRESGARSETGRATFLLLEGMMDSIDREAGLDRLYRELEALEDRLGGKRLLAKCSASTGWPRRGVYFFYERGEVRRDGHPRVVRVGTHALRPSETTLWSRLSQHRGNLGGAAPGGGNHRGSIFRKHVGSALIASGPWPDEVRNTGALAAPLTEQSERKSRISSEQSLNTSALCRSYGST